MRRFALIVLLSVFASFLGVDGHATAPAAHAAPLGGNGRLAFVTLAGQIATVNTDGSDLKVLAPGSQPAWSPDGKKIAFNSGSGIGSGIAIMNADGANIVHLPTGTYDSAPAWSPDGNKFAFFTIPDAGTLKSEIFVMDANGGNRRKLGLVESSQWWSHETPSWSPDGTQLVLALNDRLVTVSSAGGVPVDLVDPLPQGQDQHGADWSPDGSRIVFSAVEWTPEGTANIFVVAADGGGLTRLTNDPSSNSNWTPAWSPDGTRIAIRSGLGPNDAKVYTIDANGGGKTFVADGYDPDWQPAPATKVEFTQAIQELQSISALQADLQGDGKPPVPIVAGKPAAMRVLFDQVDTPTTYDVEVSGEFIGSETVVLQPGCTSDKRRRQEGGCQSADFYFTPPEGNWSVTLKVRDAGTVVEEHEFNLTSDESDAIVLKAVDVCHAQSGAAPWSCQSASSLIALASHLRKVAPTDEVTVLLGGNRVARRVTDFATPKDWMSQVVADIEDQFTVFDSAANLLGVEIYYFGLTDPAAGGYNGIAHDIPGRGALSRAVTTALGQTTTGTTIAHETGHILGLSHTGTANPGGAVAPGCWGAGGGPANWPFPDNQLRATSGSVEVGFDVSTKTALPGETTFEMMSYCAPRWISPHRYLEMLDPTGPLAPGGAVPMAAEPAGAAGAFWLVSGEINGGAAEFDPLVEFDTEGPVDQGSGAHHIEVRDGLDGVLLTRAFSPIESHPELGPGQVESEAPPIFSELIPVQAGAARIVVTDGTATEIGSLALGGTAPSVTITQAANDGDVVSIQWTVADPDSTEHTYWVDYSPDGGATWQNQAMGLEDAALALDADLLAGSDNAVVRVIASDGVNSGEATSAPFAVDGKLPEGEVIGPQGTSFREGGLVWLEAAAWDVDDGTLDDAAVTWSSSADGALGTGASLPVYDLSVGSHTITMTARDSDNNAVTDSIAITVTDSPLIEGEEPGTPRLWGDNDCDGGISSRDNQALSRFVLQQTPLSQTQPCPALGATVSISGIGTKAWGDLDCDGQITSRDGQALLRNILQQNALSQTQPCPVLGVSVTTTQAALPARVRPTGWWR